MRAGKPPRRFTMDRTAFFTNWNAGLPLEFLDSSVPLLFLGNTGANGSKIEFYRSPMVP